MKGLDIRQNKYYYDDGSTENPINYKNGKKDGWWFHYFPNGNLQACKNYTKDTLNGSYLLFASDGHLDFYGNYEMGFQRAGIKFDSIGNIRRGYPFLLLENEKDTIHLGEIYKANIRANYVPEGYECGLFLKKEEKGKEKEEIYEEIAKGVEGTYSITPKEIGEHIYEISAMILKRSAKHKDSVEHHLSLFLKGKFWVIK
jgi:hypothetical protein